jgi:hypothetical protein
VSEQEHAHLGASNAAIWMNCAEAGRQMRHAKGNTRTSIHAATGTAAHLLCEMGLTFGMDAVRQKDGDIITVDKYDIAVDEEMLKAVEKFVEHVEAHSRDALFFATETRVSLDFLYGIHNRPKVERLFGTADTIIVRRSPLDEQLELHVFDYKHGAGVPVDADTPQGKYYALGVLLSWTGNPIARVFVHIVQPRAPHPDGPVRIAEYTPKQLLDFGKEVMDAVETIHTGKGGFKTGKHCRFCPLAGQCPKLFEENLALAAGDFAVSRDAINTKGAAHNMMQAGLLGNFNILSGAEIAFILNRRDVFKRWIDSVEQEAMRRLSRNDTVQGWKLVDKRPRHVWKGEEKLGYTLKQRLTEEVLVSPAQARKRLTEEEYDRLVRNGVIVNTSSGVTLVPDSDKRPPADPNKSAKSDFEELFDALAES